MFSVTLYAYNVAQVFLQNTLLFTAFYCKTDSMPLARPSPQPEGSSSRRLSAADEIIAKNCMALLTSTQHDVLYNVPYRGDENAIIELARRVEVFAHSITTAKDEIALRRCVVLLDACLLQQMHASELRSVCRAILDRDHTLLNHMPQLITVLKKIHRAFEISIILSPEVLSAIRSDVVARNDSGEQIWGN